MTSSPESPEQQYPLAMDEYYNIQPATTKDPVVVPAPAEPVSVKATTPAITKAPAVTAPVPPVTVIPAPTIPVKKAGNVVVNQIPEALEVFLLSLTPERKREIGKYSNIPNSELVAPTKGRATAIINGFRTKHAIVPAGQRNNILFKYSCLIRRCGIDEPGINEGLWSFSLAHCKPPHSRDNRDDVGELADLAARAAKHIRVGFPQPDPKISDGNIIELPDIEGEDGVIDGGEYEPGPFKFTEPGALTELGNSMQFVNQFKSRCKFSFDSKRWYVWDNAQRWKPNHIGKVTRWGKSIVKRLYGYSTTITDEALRTRVFKHAERSNTRYGVNNLLDLAKSDLECSELDFDKDGYLLNLKDCTLDLRTGEHHEQTSDDMLSKLAGVKYDPDATCPIWENHISKVFDDNAELIKNFQEICGYTLAGIGNPSAAFFVPYGSGRNGKSVTLNTLNYILGEYAVNIAPQSLQPMKPGQIRSDLMPTKGARMITVTEPGKGMKIDDGLIKSMTGGDQITARCLYGDPISFSINGCLFLATNHKPRVSDQSTAMWTRIWMVPFKHYFDPTSPDSDPDIEKKLRKEASGILNWCLVGWQRYHENGKLVKCKAISDETNEYQNQEDFLYDFLYQKKANGEQVYKIDIHNRTIYIPATDLYDAYKQWCSLNNIRPMSSTSFGREIGSRFEKVHTRTHNVYLGIRLVGEDVQTKIER